MAARKKSVLFVCVHNSARSQMAEAFLQHLAGDRFAAASAGLEAGSLNPLAVEVMAEVGLDISRNATTDVFDLLRQEKQFDYVITVCDDTSGEHCPLFPGQAERLHWSFADPVKLTGSPEERMKEIRLIREQIRQRIAWFIEERKFFPAALRDAQGEPRA
jgi:arsenate reductase (thioredoxin)